MQIHTLAAAFGRLEHDALHLEPGLNLIESPNEGGKSTWAALLRVMLYGLNTRDRSLTADKRRYLPWSGSAMEGQLAAATHLGEVTVTRRTARANSPMGAFSAVYTGTADPVPGLTAADCGETLLGVSQDIFVRSAFIGQSSIEVKQNTDLERRIAALITTGEEDTSYTAAADRLRKQSTRLRYNKTGLLPQLEGELSALRRELEEIQTLEHDLHQDEARESELVARLAELRRELTLHDTADQAKKALAAQEAHDAMVEAQAKADSIRRSLQGSPSKEELETLRGSIAALAEMKLALQAVEAQASEKAAALEQAQAAQSVQHMTWPADHPADTPLSEKARPRLSLLLAFLALLTGGALTAVMGLLAGEWLIGLATGLGIFGLALLIMALPLRRRQAAWDAHEAELHTQRAAELEAFASLSAEVERAQTDFQQAKAQVDAAQAQFDSGADRILAQVRAFHPDTETIPAALAAVEEGIRRHNALLEARQAADTAAARWDLVRSDSADGPLQPVQRPLLSRGQLQGELTTVSSRLADLQRQIHTAQGRIQALGDPEELRLQLADGAEKAAELQEEYDAIALAAEVLASANTTLQNRFSPALGEKAAKIFTKLTKKKYNKVLLNREMVPSAQESGQILPHEAALLSQGTADQLYLAVRLAICDMVLPEEDPAPLLLDDALVNFDDGRMAAALDYLVELSEKRQILLFTCQSREGAYLSKAHPDKFHRISM